jgi:Flp pilus assembly protein TadB
MTNKVSPETQTQAMKLAKGTQKPGQTKEQTKLIAQGIEKGISEYKKQQNKKSRTRDKERKAQVKIKQANQANAETTGSSEPKPSANYLPWLLLVISWVGFSLYTFI